MPANSATDSLWLSDKANHPELEYRGGQDPVVHLEADLRTAVAWANSQERRWAYTLSNAGSHFFEDRADLSQLHEIDWDAVQTHDWMCCKDGKQAEFLIELSFPWTLVERIGSCNEATYRQVLASLPASGHRPRVEVIDEWYY